MGTQRMNIRIPVDLYEHYTKQAEELGISRTACMIMDMRKSISQDLAMNNIGRMMDAYEIEKKKGKAE